MKPPRTPGETVMAAARLALRRGGLVKSDTNHWRFQRRFFNAETVNALIASGEAVRVGNQVIAAHLSIAAE